MTLTTMENIGEEMERKLNHIGIFTPEALIQKGSKETYLQLKAAYPQVCTVHLYALQGAIEGLPLALLSTETKEELKQWSKALA